MWPVGYTQLLLFQPPLHFVVLNKIILLMKQEHKQINISLSTGFIEEVYSLLIPICQSFFDLLQSPMFGDVQ